MPRIHATCVAIGNAGVLLLGPSGSGKSDLALQLIDAGAVLVADDRVGIEVQGGTLVAYGGGKVGLLEIHGVGLVEMDRRSAVTLAAAIQLRPGGHPERLPEAAFWRHAGVALPLYTVDPAAASAAARVRLLVRQAPLAVEPPEVELQSDEPTGS